jgi:hypothetical protein
MVPPPPPPHFVHASAIASFFLAPCIVSAFYTHHLKRPRIVSISVAGSGSAHSRALVPLEPRTSSSQRIVSRILSPKPLPFNTTRKNSTFYFPNISPPFPPPPPPPPFFSRPRRAWRTTNLLQMQGQKMERWLWRAPASGAGARGRSREWCIETGWGGWGVRVSEKGG